MAAEQIREVLRARHRLQTEQDDDFTIRTQVDIGKVQEGTSETLTMMLFAIASVSLLVGGIGIMNILLVSVTERTREIGVRMAVGAKRRHIVMQFLIEAMTLSLVGGAVGIVLGITGAKLTTLIAGWPTIISGKRHHARVLLLPCGRPVLRIVPCEQGRSPQSYRSAPVRIVRVRVDIR